MRKVFSGHQPNFLPSMGVLYKVFKSDVFIWDDDVQFTSKEYRGVNGVKIGHNANAIRVGDNRCQITVPVSYSFGDKINETRINYSTNWDEKMLKTIKMNYGKYPFFELGYSLLEDALSKKFTYLSELNLYLLDKIVKGFGFDTKIVIASKDLPTDLMKNERNVWQCVQLGGNVYYSGTGGGRIYNDEEMYRKNGIEIEYSDFEPTPYRQYHKKSFIPHLSVLDYIMNEGFKIPDDWRK